jgi:hypothetical protein
MCITIKVGKISDPDNPVFHYHPYGSFVPIAHIYSPVVINKVVITLYEVHASLITALSNITFVLDGFGVFARSDIQADTVSHSVVVIVRGHPNGQGVPQVLATVRAIGVFSDDNDC